MRKYIYKHTSFENAYEVDNYPWGFRLKTKVRYWVETQDKKRGGQRFCKCTMNPKTDCWCKPKKNNYYDLIAMFLNDENHVKWCYADYNSEAEILNGFIKTHEENLTEYQIKTIADIKRYQKAVESIDFTCKLEKTIEIR